jgi:hypothetical protein
VPGGREWDLLHESLVTSLTPLSKDKSAAGAEQLLTKVFRMAFHEIYRRLPLFREAVIHSEQEFSRLKGRIAAIKDEETAKVEQLKSEGFQASCAAEVCKPPPLLSSASFILPPLEDSRAHNLCRESPMIMSHGEDEVGPKEVVDSL